MAASSKKAWAEAEKLGLLFQIIAEAGTVPWDKLKLPEGRTKKACELMISNEKQKVKKAREADGSEDGVAATPSGKNKRTGEMDDEESPTKKKPKTPRNKMVVKAASEQPKEQDNDEAVKPEPEDDELA